MLRFGLFYAIFSPFLVLLSFWFWDVVLKLDGARVAEAELAVTRERLRFASDLHDIQGHHLQVIALKAELAQRLLERDPEAAKIQLRETRVAAREALEETRGLVQGLRQVSLGEELDNAADVLSAAGIACERRAEAEPRNPGVRRVLGLAVREATTNLLRHASPTAASFELSREADGADGAQRWRLSVVNDGVADAPSETGTGLLGLRERLEPLGGELSTTSRDGCFRLELLVPVPADPEGAAGPPASPGRRGPVGKDEPPSPRTEETLA